MKRRRMQQKRMAQWAATSCVVLLLAGCQSTPADSDTAGTENSGKEIISNGPQQAYLESGETTAIDAAPPLPPADSDEHASAEASSMQQDQKKTAASGDEPGVWDGEKPQLKGIAIGDSDEDVSGRIGQAFDSYVLDEQEPVSVREYDGFSVGFNRSGAVQFVEVYGEGAASGLGGLKIGDSQQEAILHLGPPQSQTEYLLAYAAEGALLRLDVDPATNEIVSIKLLAHS